MNQFEPIEIETDVRGVSASLDRLAAVDRASAPGSLEDRAFMASRAGLRADLEAAGSRGAEAGAGSRDGAPVFRLGWLMSGLRLAACVTVVGMGAATWLAVSHRPAAAAVDTDLTAWLETYPSGDDGWTELGSRIDVLHADLLSVAATLGDTESGEDGLGSGGDGEAM